MTAIRASSCLPCSDGAEKSQLSKSEWVAGSVSDLRTDSTFPPSSRKPNQRVDSSKGNLTKSSYTPA